MSKEVSRIIFSKVNILVLCQPDYIQYVSCTEIFLSKCSLNLITNVTFSDFINPNEIFAFFSVL